jgi:RND family efflux transporter MFP subunit
MKKIISLMLPFYLAVLTQTALAAQAVQVQRFVDIAFARSLQYPATVVNLRQSQVAAEINARVLKINIEVGDSIKRGQVLIELDCELPQIELTRSEAGLKRLKANRLLTRQQLDRAKKLRKSNSVSRQELDQRQTQLDAASASIDEQQALLKSVRQQIRNCQIKAPFDGVITRRIANVGAYARTGSPQLTLTDAQAVELEAKIPLHELELLHRASHLSFKQAGKTYDVKIRSQLPVVDSQSLQAILRLSFISAQRPPGGSFGVLQFDSPKNYLPAQLLQKRDGVMGVFVLRAGKAEFVALEQAQAGQPVAVDFAADTRIITSHLQLLNHQQAVEIATPDAE